MALNDLYGDGHTVQLAKGGKDDFDHGTFDNAAKHVYTHGGFNAQMMSDEDVRALTQETYRVLSSAIGVKQEVPDELRRLLSESTFVFSGFKTYHELREVSAMMQDEDGGFKSWDKFSQEVTAIDQRYNKNYLQAEYNFAVQSAQMAAKWKDFEADGDEYLLQYRTAGDDKVRAEHAVLHGVTLPIDDPFWDEYLPPLDWGCRCTTVQVRREKYPVSNSEDAIAAGERATDTPKKKIFRFNPGKTGNLFPPKHPYFKLTRQDKPVVKEAIEAQVAEELHPDTFTAKTIEEAEQLFRDTFGVNCSLKGFKKADLSQVADIFHCVEHNFALHPELKRNTQYVGSVTGRIEMIIERSLQKWEEINGRKAPDFIVKEYTKRIRKICGAGGAYAYSHAAYSEFGMAGIAWNTSWTGEKFRLQIESDVAYKWHPIGCASAKAVIDHEIGHQIDNLLGLGVRSEFLEIYSPAIVQGKQYIKDNLSEYGAKNKAEFIAEAWSEYLNNPEPRPIAKAVGELIIKKLGELADN